MQHHSKQGDWVGVWQTELLNLLQVYESYREQNSLFFLRLLGFFFLVNSACYWLAISVSFPELFQEQFVRMLTIQQPVALMGGLFDSLSFFVTVWLIQQAIKSQNGLRFFGILAVDLLIAMVATAWVLLVVIVSSWLVGPPQLPEAEIKVTATVQSSANLLAPELVLVAVDEPDMLNEDNLEDNDQIVETPQPDSAVAPVLSPDNQAENSGVAEAQASEHDATGSEKENFKTSFYQDMLVNALSDPFANIRYFLFGIVMGLSTLLPTFFHIFMAFRSRSSLGKERT